MADTTRKTGLTHSLVRSALVTLAALTPVTVQAAAAEDATYLFAGTHRDFRAANINKGGHPDFEADLPNGRAVYAGIAADTLNTVGGIEFASTGYKVLTSAMDAKGQRTIGAKPYLQSRLGDTPCLASPTEGNAVTSETSFGQWYNESLAAMKSQTGMLPFTASGGRMVYDGVPHRDIQGLAGTGANKNWGFTYELHLDFVYHADRNDEIVCGADDALWVYLDGRLVVDLGGSHDFAEQVFEVNRMNGLVDGKTYRLSIFYAERQKARSRLKIDTTLELSGVSAPEVSGHHD